MTDTSTHEMTAEIPVKFTPVGFNGFETSYITVRIEFTYRGGRRGSYEPGGGDPPEGAEIKLVSATVVEDDDHLNLSQSRLDECVQDWLDDDAGYDRACQHAENEL